jgi:hypothetical protein
MWWVFFMGWIDFNRLKFWAEMWPTSRIGLVSPGVLKIPHHHAMSMSTSLLSSRSAATSVAMWQTTSLCTSLKPSESAAMWHATLAARWHTTSAIRWHPCRHPCGIQVSSHVTSVNNNPWRFYFVTDSEPWVGLHGPQAAPWWFRYVTDRDIY